MYTLHVQWENKHRMDEGIYILNLNEHFLKIWVKKRPGNVRYSTMNISKCILIFWIFYLQLYPFITNLVINLITMRNENIFFNIIKFWQIRKFLHTKLIDFKITFCTVDQYCALSVIIVKMFKTLICIYSKLVVRSEWYKPTLNSSYSSHDKVPNTFFKLNCFHFGQISCEFRDYRSSNFELYCLLSCDTVYSGRNLAAFQSNLSILHPVLLPKRSLK